jgi:hypothetical protein
MSKTSLRNSIETAIHTERKSLEGKALSSNHQLSKKQYYEITDWLFETFNSVNISYNNDNSAEPLNITIVF